MFSKIVGYLIGGAFVLGILLGPGVGLYLVSKDSIEALSYEGETEAKVVKCVSLKSPSNNRSQLRKVPVVKLESGQIVKGSIDEIRFISKCADLIGRTVEVKFDLKNPKKAKINTFLEMYFQPLLALFICLLLYPFIILGYLKKYKK